MLFIFKSSVKILSIRLLIRFGELLRPYGKSLVGQWRQVSSRFLPRPFKYFVFFKSIGVILSISLLTRLGELLRPYGKSLVVQWRKVASKFVPRVLKGFPFFKAFVMMMMLDELLKPCGTACQ